MPHLIFDPATPTQTRKILAEMGAAPNRTLGQNFLIDGDALDGIAQAGPLEKTESGLEIGPGLGSLTVRLLARAGNVVAIEKDRKYAQFLTEKLANQPFRLIDADALDVAWHDLGLPDGAKIVANLPYFISKPMLRRIVEDWRPHLKSATVLVQREVAQRLIAAPNTSEYGPLSIMTALYCRAEIAFNIAPEAFLPAPKVVSSVIHLEMLATPSIELKNEKRFWLIVRAAFGQRRKTLGNTLKPLAPREVLVGAFEKLGIDPQRRGETLSVAEFAGLSELI